MRLLILLCLPVISYAQVKIQGKILDKESGQPVPFASVGIVGTSKGTAANLDGEFSFVVNGSISIKITCVGYESIAIESPLENGIYQLRPSNTRLKDLTILANELDGEKIVVRAFREVKNNMNAQPFVQKFFYRHYCKDDSVYGRLIEAAAEVYKNNGYRVQRSRSGQHEEIRVTQIRRSFDRTKVVDVHLPIAVREALELDVAGYQMKYTDILPNMAGYVSCLKMYRKHFDFKLEGISSYDGKDVYIVSYKSKPGMASWGYRVQPQSGRLYIVTQTFAIVKAEMQRSRSRDTWNTVVSYRAYNGKYYPYHVVHDGHTNYATRNFQHTYHLELMSTEIQTAGFEKFKGKTFSREGLISIPFDSAFWASYPMVKATPLEESIIADLGGGLSLNTQFKLYQQQEIEALASTSDSEADFLKFKESARGKRILFVGFWASGCGPCLREMPFEIDLAADYAGKVTFVLVSVDNNAHAWEQAIHKYQLRRPGFVHFRVGPNAATTNFYLTDGMPQYVLIDRNGDHFSVNAKRPSNPLLRKDLDELVKAKGNN